MGKPSSLAQNETSLTDKFALRTPYGKFKEQTSDHYRTITELNTYGFLTARDKGLALSIPQHWVEGICAHLNLDIRSVFSTSALQGITSKTIRNLPENKIIIRRNEGVHNGGVISIAHQEELKAFARTCKPPAAEDETGPGQSPLS